MNLHARIWGVGGGGQGVPPGTGYVHAVPDGVALVQSLIKCIALEAIAVHWPPLIIINTCQRPIPLFAHKQGQAALSL